MEFPPSPPDPLGGGGGGSFSDVGVVAPFVDDRDEVKVMEELELKRSNTIGYSRYCVLIRPLMKLTLLESKDYGVSHISMSTKGGFQAYEP